MNSQNLLSFWSHAMLRDLFDFSKKRNGKDAVVFYLFYMGCFALLTLAVDF
jgi:hypothetical protein